MSDDNPLATDRRSAQPPIDVEKMRANLHGTFNGGWHHSKDGMEAFHHGMDTVCNVLAAYFKGESSNGILPELQVEVLADRRSARAPREPQDEEMQDDQSRVEPSVPCVEPTGSIAEKSPGAVITADRTDLAVDILRLMLAEPFGCPMCDSGTLRNPMKDHWPACGFGRAQALVGHSPWPAQAPTRLPLEELADAEDGVPVDVRQELMACALQNGRISYHYLCRLYKRGRIECHADLADARAQLEEWQKECREGHARLNETRVKDVPGDLYTRISAIIQLLSDERSEAQHLLLATSAEKDALQAKAEAAEHRRLAAEYRAQRIVLDAELQSKLTKAQTELADARAQIVALQDKLKAEEAFGSLTFESEQRLKKRLIEIEKG